MHCVLNVVHVLAQLGKAPGRYQDLQTQILQAMKAGRGEGEGLDLHVCDNGTLLSWHDRLVIAMSTC